MTEGIDGLIKSWMIVWAVKWMSGEFNGLNDETVSGCMSKEVS
jgi:hypothetical protein